MEIKVDNANALPHVRWSAVALGALLAVGGRILLGVLANAIWADNDVSTAWPATVMVLAALLTTFLGALVAVRVAAAANIRNAYLHGLAAFSLALVVLAGWLRPFFLMGAWAEAGEAARGVNPWNDVLIIVMGLVGALLGSAVGRRNVLGQPAFHGAGMPLSTRFSLRNERAGGVLRTRNAADAPRADDPHDAVH